MSAPVESYRVEPDDPRAPPEDVWERLSEEERARIVASLPSEFPASGDPHLDAKARTRQTLLEADEMIVELRRMMEQVEAHREEEARQREEAERKLAEQERLRTEAEKKLAEALAEIERLRRER